MYADLHNFNASLNRLVQNKPEESNASNVEALGILIAYPSADALPGDAWLKAGRCVSITSDRLPLFKAAADKGVI